MNFPEAEPDESTVTQPDRPSPSDEATERRLARLIRAYWRKAGHNVAVEIVCRDGAWGIRSDLGPTGLPR